MQEVSKSNDLLSFEVLIILLKVLGTKPSVSWANVAKEIGEAVVAGISYKVKQEGLVADWLVHNILHQLVFGPVLAE